MVIPPNTRFPITRKITIGLDKSMLIELPVDLQNVLVSNPDVVDAVVQSSRQVYLLAKDVGDANAFFMGADGQRLVFLEVSVTRDLTPLNDALNRLLPGARIKAEAVGDNVVLTGSVINPDRLQPCQRYRRPLRQEEGQRRQHAQRRRQGAGAAPGAGGGDAARRHPAARGQYARARS